VFERSQTQRCGCRSPPGYGFHTWPDAHTTLRACGRCEVGHKGPMSSTRIRQHAPDHMARCRARGAGSGKSSSPCRAGDNPRASSALRGRHGQWTARACGRSERFPVPGTSERVFATALARAFVIWRMLSLSILATVNEKSVTGGKGSKRTKGSTVRGRSLDRFRIVLYLNRVL
jgi:hypothetical protein